MNLSMWIINDWLRKYHPVATILSGKMVIEKIHLISHDIDKEESTLIIGKARDFFEESESNEVLLMNNNDVISLRTCDLDIIFNEVSNAFAYYNHWEMQLLLDASGEEPEQQIIDDSTELFGPMFLMDLKMDSIAMSKKYGTGAVNKAWNCMLAKDSSILPILKKLRGTWFFENYSAVQKNVLYEIHDVEELYPYRYGIIISQLNKDGELIAQMVIAHKEKFTTSEVQLSSVIYKALAAVKTPKKSIDSTEIIGTLLTFMLEDSKNINKYKEFICSVNNWNETDEFGMVIFKKKAIGTTSSGKLILHMFHTMLSNSIITSKENHIIAFINVSKNTQYLNQLHVICSQYEYNCSISYIYSGFHNMNFMERQCMKAIKQNIKFFSEIAYQTIINHLGDSEFISACIHPVVNQLQSYDRCNNTQFFETLKIYLQCERNWVKSAKKMYVHKNTVMFRIEKILSSFCLKLEDAEEREYLLFSYRIFKKK